MWKRRRGKMLAHYYAKENQTSIITLTALCGVTHPAGELVNVERARPDVSTEWVCKHKLCIKLLRKVPSHGS